MRLLDRTAPGSAILLVESVALYLVDCQAELCLQPALAHHRRVFASERSLPLVVMRLSRRSPPESFELVAGAAADSEVVLTVVPVAVTPGRRCCRCNRGLRKPEIA